MKPPGWLLVVVSVLGVLSIAGLALSLSGKGRILGAIADFALVLTLAAVLLYVYYTYALAKDVWMPSASFALKPYPNDPYHFAFFLQNHSKLSLSCWCRLNATIYGQAVSLEGFYNGDSSFDLQPFGSGTGHFDIGDILAKANRRLYEMKNTASKNPKEQLYLNIDFWYNPVGTNAVTRNPRQPHYFDFARDVMVADF